MSARVKALGERKALLVARLQLQRMEVVLRANELREAIRPASLIGGAVAQPAALIAIFDTIAPILGLRKWSRWVRAGSVGIMALRIMRNWRAAQRAASTAAETQPPPGATS